MPSEENLATGNPAALRDGDAVAVVVNSRARRASRGHWRERVEAVLARRFRPTFHYPESVGDTARVAHACAHDGHGAVVVAGGDGTINAVARSLAGTRVPLGLLPLGTGNDLVRTLGLPPEPGAAATALVDKRPRLVDLVEVNGHPYCTVGLLGLVAESALAVIRRNALGSPWRPVLAPLGASAYRLSGVAAMLSPRPMARRVQLTWRDPESGEERRYEGGAAGFFITNGRHLGGGLALPVASSIDDGVFEICLVRAVPRVKLIYAFACLTQGRPLPRGVLDVARADRATVVFDQPGPFSADGEDLFTAASFEFTIRPRTLAVLA